MKHQSKVPHRLYAETQMGIVTRFGDWFHTTTEQIEEFVPGLLENVALSELIRGAQAWVKSADSLAMIILLILLLATGPITAAVITLIFHGFWYIYKSSFVAVSLNTVMEFLYKDGTQLILSLVIISYLGVMAQYAAAGVGLLFFFLFKLGLLKKMWDKVYPHITDRPLTLNDRVLKMVILRYAIQQNVAPEEVQDMEQQIADLATRRKKK